jgi:hypothetical protein
MNTGRLFLLSPLLLIFAAGCGDTSKTPAQLSGTVKYNNKAVTGGTILLIAKGAEGKSDKAKGSYTIYIKPDGTYSATDLPVGDFDATIETESVNTQGRPTPDQYGGSRGGKDKGRTVSPAPEDKTASSPGGGGTYVKIPAKFAKKDTSGLTVTLTKGSNEHNFELKD